MDRVCQIGVTKRRLFHGPLGHVCEALSGGHFSASDRAENGGSFELLPCSGLGDYDELQPGPALQIMSLYNALGVRDVF